jgi:hypothetical protein
MLYLRALVILFFSGALYIKHIYFYLIRVEAKRTGFMTSTLFKIRGQKQLLPLSTNPIFVLSICKTCVVYNVSPAMRNEGWDEFSTCEMAICDSPTSAATDPNKLWEIKLSESLCCMPPGNSISIWPQSAMWKRHPLSTVLFLFLWFLLFSFYFRTGVEDERTSLNYVGFNCGLMIYLTMK